MRTTITSIDEETGEVVYVGWFNNETSVVVASNNTRDSTRWSEVLFTAGGKFIMCNYSQWQGEDGSYRVCSIEEAIAVGGIGEIIDGVDAITDSSKLSQSMRDNSRSMLNNLQELSVMTEL